MRALALLVLVGCVNQPAFVGKATPIDCSKANDPGNGMVTHDAPCEGMMFGDHCYVWDQMAYTPWQAAVDACNGKGGYLATPANAAEDSLTQTVIVGGGQAWLGAKQTTGVTTHPTGEPVTFTRWNSTMDGCAMQDPSGWGTQDCTAAFMGHVCEFPGWTQFQGHSYRHFFQELTWSAARAKCESLGAHLATISSSCEGDFVREVFAYGSEMWLGAQKNADAFAWITGEEWDYEAFDTGEGTVSDQKCLAVTPANGLWLDADCAMQRRYICERDP